MDVQSARIAELERALSDAHERCVRQYHEATELNNQLGALGYFAHRFVLLYLAARPIESKGELCARLKDVFLLDVDNREIYEEGNEQEKMFILEVQAFAGGDWQRNLLQTIQHCEKFHTAPIN